MKCDKHIAHISLKNFRTSGVIHLSYCILVWGSKIKNNHPLSLLQTKAVRNIANEDYIAHSEALCKSLNILKMPDIFTCSLSKFYYKLLQNQLPTYFDVMIPMLPNICNIYNIRHPTFHLSLGKHDFAEQRLDYQFFKF